MTHKMWTSFKTLASKKVTVWLKKSQSNNKLLYNSSSHTIKNIEASCSSNAHTGEKGFLQLLLVNVCGLFLFGQSKKNVYFGLIESSLHF